MKYLLKTSLAIVALMIGGVAMAGNGPIAVDIVDNEDIGDGATAFGPWSTSSAAGFCGKNSVFSNDSKKPATFRFESDLPTARPGVYIISVKWTYHPNRSNAVPHTVEDDNTISLISIDQNQDGAFVPDCDGEEDFIGLAIVECGRVNSCAVTVSAAGGQASADAVKWELIEEFDPPPAEPTTCPCERAYNIAAAALFGLELNPPNCSLDAVLPTIGVAGITGEINEESQRVLSIIGIQENAGPPYCTAKVRTIDDNGDPRIVTTLEEAKELTPEEAAGCLITVQQLAPLMGCEPPVDPGTG